jgi:large subunit ribosomal protein L29
MAIRSARELQEMSVAELQNQTLKTKEELMKLRFKHSTGQLTDTASINKKKTEIARILTVINQKELDKAK